MTWRAPNICQALPRAVLRFPSTLQTISLLPPLLLSRLPLPKTPALM
jgi:hypothetical protein